MIFRKILCWMFGHRSKLLFSYHAENGRVGSAGSEITIWKCECCLKENKNVTLFSDFKK